MAAPSRVGEEGESARARVDGDVMMIDKVAVETSRGGTETACCGPSF